MWWRAYTPRMGWIKQKTCESYTNNAWYCPNSIGYTLKSITGLIRTKSKCISDNSRQLSYFMHKIEKAACYGYVTRTWVLVSSRGMSDSAIYSRIYIWPKMKYWSPNAQVGVSGIRQRLKTTWTYLLYEVTCYGHKKREIVQALMLPLITYRQKGRGSFCDQTEEFKYLENQTI